MPLPRVRFTVRRLMVAVAIAGLIWGSGLFILRRSERFRWLERHHDMRTSHHIITTPYYTALWNGVGERVSPGKARWHVEMARKYDFAARFPFLPVPPDPPEPE